MLYQPTIYDENYNNNDEADIGMDRNHPRPEVHAQKFNANASGISANFLKKEKNWRRA